MNTAHTLWRGLLRPARLVPLFAFLTAVPLCAQLTQGSNPSLINYQGRLTDAQGNPVTGNRTMSVKLYDAPTGGIMTYEETIGTVAVRNGTYSFSFGGSGVVASALNGQDHLALTVNGTEETTRTRLLAVPYALKSNESADTEFLRDELVAAGLLPEAPSFTAYYFVTSSITDNSTESLQILDSTLLPNFGGKYEGINTWFQRKLTANDRIISTEYFWTKDVKITRTDYPGDTSKGTLQIWAAMPVTEPTPSVIHAGFHYPIEPPLTKDFKGHSLNYNGIEYKLFRIFALQGPGSTVTFRPIK